MGFRLFLFVVLIFVLVLVTALIFVNFIIIVSVLVLVLVLILTLVVAFYQGPVASVFWLDEALESALRLDAIVTLVDAKNIRRQLQRVPEEEGGSGEEATAEEQGKRPKNEAAMQIAYADRVLINKVRICCAVYHSTRDNAKRTNVARRCSIC